MKPTIKHKQIVILTLLLVIFSIIMVQGCGDSSTQCTAPDGSLITINPSSQPIDTGGTGLAQNVIQNWTVRVAYPDDTPMPNACITVSGALAVPNGDALYQFQFYPASVFPNLPVNSGFAAETDDFGQYTFSTLISAGTGTFFDTIFVQSGTNLGTAEVRIE